MQPQLWAVGLTFGTSSHSHSNEGKGLLILSVRLFFSQQLTSMSEGRSTIHQHQWKLLLTRVILFATKLSVFMGEGPTESNAQK
jgi:hypothetical protein